MTTFPRRRRALRIGPVAVCACAVAASFIGSHAPVQAEGIGAPASPLGGYRGTAISSGLYAYYSPEGLLPVGAIVDLGAPDALATITSGPATFARASAADPGDLLANPDAILSLGVPGYPQGALPAYPYRATATSGYGEPKAESTPAPGLHARAEVAPGTSTAEATMPGSDAPAVATFQSLSARSSTSTDGSTVSAHVRTQVDGFDLLNILTVDSIVTELTATSVGDGTELAGETIIMGASLLGEPVTIDATGVHRPPDEGDDSTATELVDNANQLLAQAGIRVTLAGPVKQQGANAGQLASSGLRIDLEISPRTYPIISELAGAVPPTPGLIPGAPTPDDVLAAAQAHHLSRIEVGRGAVALSATPGFSFDQPTEPVVWDQALTPTAKIAPSYPGVAPAVVPPAKASALAPIAPARSERVPNLPLGAGVGALGTLLLLTQPILGTRLARSATTLLGGGESSSCPNGGR